MRRFLKAALLSAVALLAAGALALGIFVDREASAPDLKPRIEKAAAELLGRPVSIGSLEWRRWPDTMLIAKSFQVYDDPQKTRVLVESPVVEAHVALLSVFKLAAGVTELRFVSPRIALRRDKDGLWNVERLAREIAARPDEPRRRWGSLAFNWFEIAGGTVTVADESGGLSAFPPLDVSGRGKLRLLRTHADFPYELAVRPEGSPASLALSGSFGGSWRLRAVLEKGDPALASLVWPPAARWTGRWDAEVERDETKMKGWRVRARAAPLVISTSAPRIDLLEVTGTYASAERSSFTAVARSSATDIEAQGSVRDGVLDLNVKSRQLDMNALLALARAAATAPAPTRLRATISIEELRYGPAALQAVHADVRHSTGPYYFENVALKTLGGSLAGSGSYLPGGGDAALGLAWTASGVDLQELFRAAGSSQEAAGTVDSRGQLQTGLGDRFLPGMSGTVTADLKNGWLGGVSGLLKVLTRVNLTTLLAEAAGHHRQRVPFDEAHAAATIVKGKLSTSRPLVLKNKTLELAFMGSYDLPTRTVDGRVVVHVLTVTDEIIKLIPGVREILLGNRKSMIPIWLKVTGKADDPDVDVQPGKTISAPFWNTIKNLFRLPKTLSKELGL